jgi:hypothetical protein
MARRFLFRKRLEQNLPFYGTHRQSQEDRTIIHIFDNPCMLSRYTRRQPGNQGVEIGCGQLEACGENAKLADSWHLDRASSESARRPFDGSR